MVDFGLGRENGPLVVAILKPRELSIEATAGKASQSVQHQRLLRVETFGDGYSICVCQSSNCRQGCRISDRLKDPNFAFVFRSKSSATAISYRPPAAAIVGLING